MKTAISIGNFDAVHVGHIELVHTARNAVGEDGLVEIWSFDPPPATILDPSLPLDRLTTFEQRKVLLIEAGADRVVQLVPTSELLSQSPKEFISMLVHKSHPSYIVEGEGFRFGKNRAGSLETLQEFGLEYEFACVGIQGIEVSLRDHSVVRASSSMVRWLLNAGRVEDANIILGRAFQVTGTVVQGDQRGRTLGTPTANLGEVQTMLPRNGIYAGLATVDGKTYPTAISIGTKPTFGAHDRVCEIHIIGFNGELDQYGWQLTGTISHWIRDQIRFESSEALRTAISQDIETATKLIESNK